MTAIGEIFSYIFATTNSAAVRAKMFDRIYTALLPGELFVFNMAGPARVPSISLQHTSAGGPDWTVLVEAEADIDKVVVVQNKMFRFMAVQHNERDKPLTERPSIKDNRQSSSKKHSFLRHYQKHPVTKGRNLLAIPPQHPRVRGCLFQPSRCANRLPKHNFMVLL